MSRNVVTIVPDTPLPEIERLMIERNAGRLPVMDGDRLVGNLVLKGFGDPKFDLESLWLFLRELRHRHDLISSVDPRPQQTTVSQTRRPRCGSTLRPT